MNDHSKRSLISSILILLLISSASAGPHFLPAQKYYVGDVQWFGQYRGAAERPTYEFNGDGLGDLFMIVDDTVRIMYGTSSGTFIGPVKTDIILAPSYGWCEHLILDINNDGLDDILASGQVSFRAWLNEGNGDFVYGSVGGTFFWDYFGCWSSGGSFMMHPTVSYDCNSDGYDEFMAYPMWDYDNYDCSPCALYFLENLTDSSYSAAATLEGGEGYCQLYGSFDSKCLVTTGDFNGDGYLDIWQSTHYNAYQIFEGGDECQFSYFDGTPIVAFNPHRIRVGDFNGDHIDDFAVTAEMLFGVQISLGDPVQMTRQIYPSWTSEYGDAFLICAADFDVDGYDDVAIQTEPLGDDGMWEVNIHYSAGDTFQTGCDTLLLPASNWYEYKVIEMYSSDFDYNGRDDLCYFCAPDTLAVLLSAGPVSTLLQRFDLRLDSYSRPYMEWEVSESADCESFDISRAIGRGEATSIASIEADHSSSGYSFIDEDIESLAGSVVTYRLEVARKDSSVELLAEDQVMVPRAELILHQNFPNPFNPGTVISFSLPERAAVSLDIYDVSGRLVRNLIEGERMDAGLRTVEWDGRNDEGRPVSSGIYYCRLAAGKDILTRKMVLMR